MIRPMMSFQLLEGNPDAIAGRESGCSYWKRIQTLLYSQLRTSNDVGRDSGCVFDVLVDVIVPIDNVVVVVDCSDQRCCHCCC